MLPGIIVGPFVGALVDRWNRRTVMIVADGGIALATIALGLIYWGGHMQPWHVFALMFVRPWAAGSIGPPCRPVPR
jgi:DHA3 family macrolide efflux protein-like MFS transporter